MNIKKALPGCKIRVFLRTSYVIYKSLLYTYISYYHLDTIKRSCTCLWTLFNFSRKRHFIYKLVINELSKGFFRFTKITYHPYFQASTFAADMKLKQNTKQKTQTQTLQYDILSNLYKRLVEYFFFSCHHPWIISLLQIWTWTVSREQQCSICHSSAYIPGCAFHVQ